jgi:hypothetical protein
LDLANGSAIRGFEPGGVRAGMGLAPKLLWVWIQKKKKNPVRILEPAP